MKRIAMQDTNLKKWKSIIVENNKIIKAFAYCIKLSWRVSKVYTVLQFLARIVSGFLPVLITWNTKEIIDILSVGAGAEIWQRRDLLLIRMGIMLFLFLLKLFATQVHTYVSVMQRDRVLHFVEQELSSTAMRMKLEYFDDPKYYDMFETVRMDIFSLSSAMNDGVSAVSYMVSLCSCIYFLAGLGPAYTVLIVAATVPMAVSEYIYTKELYSWGVDHMREEREMSYLYWVATDRGFAQEIRVFGTQEYLIEKYRKVWDNYISNKSELSKKKAKLNCLLSVFPEFIVVVALFITGSRVFAGTATIGDFTLYNGLLVQLIEYLRGMVVSFMGLVEKKLQIEHVSEFEKLVGEEYLSGGETA